MNLRQITTQDQLGLKKVYFDSIQSLDEKIYSQEQKEPGQAKLGIIQILKVFNGWKRMASW